MHISIKLSTVPVTRTCMLANTHSVQTLEQVIINHSRAELVNTNDPNNSAVHLQHAAKGEKHFHKWLISPHSLA